jgi:hypothetical protein
LEIRVSTQGPRLSGRDDEEDDVSFGLVVLSDVCLKLGETEYGRIITNACGIVNTAV